mgnify:CR=1 FL=1
MPNKDVPITYRKSFLASYIMSDDRIKEVYTKLKNKLMSIDSMKSRISWFYDAFNVGRINFAKIRIRGKYLALYLNLEPSEYPINIYHQEDVRERRRYKDTCFKIHVKSNRTLKYAFKLIDDEIYKFNLTTHDIPNENYYLNYESEEPLVERGLIEIVENHPKQELFTYKAENILEGETIRKNEYHEQNKQIRFVDGSKVFVKERKSFEAKLIQSSSSCKNYYEVIKNALLVYTKVKSRISWKYESFTLGVNKLAKMQVRGKYLVLFLNLDKTKIDDKRIEDGTKLKQMVDTPIMLRIKDDSRLDFALELIQMLKKRYNLEEGFIKENQKYIYDFESNNDLIDKGLIKVYAKFGDYTNPEEALMGNEILSKKNNNFPVYKETKCFTLQIDENNNFVEKEEIVTTLLEGERDIIYLDEIEKNFNDGDTVSLETLKKKGMLMCDCLFYKIVYRGGYFTKKLDIIATVVSPSVQKIIIEAGSNVTIKVGD